MITVIVAIHRHTYTPYEFIVKFVMEIHQLFLTNIDTFSTPFPGTTKTTLTHTN